MIHMTRTQKVLYITIITLVAFSLRDESSETQQSPLSNTEITQASAQEPSRQASPVLRTIQSAPHKGSLVRRVIDGDTIELADGSRVRYIGVDTPETVHPKKQIECFGKEAKERNRQLVEGKRVTLEQDVSNTDRYGRLLRYVTVDGIVVNETLIREGYALPLTIPPDMRSAQRFRALAQEAREAQRGLWGACR